MEMLLLILIILMLATAFVYAGEIMLYLSLVFGSIISDIQKLINSTKKRKK